MQRSIAFVGAGPTTLYTLSALLKEDTGPLRISVFEEQDDAGLGGPYRPGWNDPAMLANIASAEIPALAEPLLVWLQSRPPAELQKLRVDPQALDDRTFIPRVALGRYFRAQFEALISYGRRKGVDIDVRTRCRVIDVAVAAEGVVLTITPRRGMIENLIFDRVVLATGHQWPAEQEVRPGYFLSPWPASALSRIPPVSVGIRGSSLTAVDAAVALAGAHGEFVRTAAGLIYSPHANSEGFTITMMSRKGVLPEADFYFPLPHTPLAICSEAAIEGLILSGRPDLLDAAFDLFRQELIQVDPDYAEATGIRTATLEEFGERYFAGRAASDPFDWAAENLFEARYNHQARVVVPWRYAILRMHESMAAIVPHLDGADFDSFNRHLKPVFVDTYGAVPHESIERMLALHRAGRLRVMPLRDDYLIDTHRSERGVLVSRRGDDLHFPVFIEATGQRSMTALQFPFLSLLQQGVIRDDGADDSLTGSRGIMIDDDFHPMVNGVPVERLFCLSLPFIMGRHPFIQGITSSHEMGETVAGALTRSLTLPARGQWLMRAQAV